MIIPDTTQGWLDIVKEKDAEIKRLKAQNAQLKQWDLMTDEQIVLGLKEAYDIVQDHLVKAEQQLRVKDARITELCVALDLCDPEHLYPPHRELLRRAREATR